jgi:hypothetical protein
MFFRRYRRFPDAKTLMSSKMQQRVIHDEKSCSDSISKSITSAKETLRCLPLFDIDHPKSNNKQQTKAYPTQPISTGFSRDEATLNIIDDDDEATECSSDFEDDVQPT